MDIDWQIVATIASPIIALFIGALLEHAIGERPRVVAYLGHVSGIHLPQLNPPTQVNTHSVVIRNAGRKKAHKVRLGHNVLPAYQVFPDTSYEERDLPGGQKEIIFPELIPKKQITVSYLYFPPLTWEQVNTHIESDDGPVKVLNVLPTVQPPKWLRVILWALIGYGVIAVLYTFYELLVWVAT